MNCENCETARGTIHYQIHKDKFLYLCLTCYEVLEEYIALRRALRGK
jgi:protein-arginine kinase activator protein McsA